MKRFNSCRQQSLVPSDGTLAGAGHTGLQRSTLRTLATRRWACAVHLGALVLVASTGLSAPPAALTPDPTPVETLESIDLALRDGDAQFDADPVRALEIYRKIVAGYPADARGYWRVAVACAQLGQSAEGLTALDKSVSLDPSLRSSAKYAELERLLHSDVQKTPSPQRSTEQSLAVATAWRRIDAARAILAKDPKDQSAQDAAAVEELVAQAFEAIRNLIQDPEQADLEIWELAGRISIVRKDDNLAAFAFEAISRLNPEYSRSTSLLSLMADLNRPGIEDNANKIRSNRQKWKDTLRLALAGDRDAQFEMGVNCAFDAHWVAPKDLANAHKWFLKAAEQGDAVAQFNVAIALMSGDGVTKDETAALGWLQAAADQGYAYAQASLGESYYFGTGGTVDQAQAVHWFQKAAEQGHVRSQFNLGHCYDNGVGVAADLTQAVAWYRKAAEAGHGKAQLNLALCYEKGDGVGQSDEEAASWMLKAAQQGDPEAQHVVGRYFEDGKGVARNPATAVDWYRKAAESGHTSAQTDLAWCYSNGQGITKDLVEGAAWYRRAAESGNVVAQYNLGLCFKNGEGVAQDAKAALTWFHKAAMQGDSQSMAAIGSIYFLGAPGVPASERMGLDWLKKAARAGDVKSQQVLKDWDERW